MSSVTKRALAASLKKLMEKTPLDKITVVDVVTECGVNRQTFYYHFQDIYDLLGWIYRTEAIDGIAGFRTYSTWPQGFLMIFQYVMANKAFCKNTFHSIGREHLDHFLHEVTYDLMMGVINEVADGKNVSDQEKDFMANFYSYAFIGILAQWILDDMQEDPKRIVNNLCKLIEGDIPRAIEKYAKDSV
ncbi:MAG: dihydroxyacetone kinase transcriptional activator DhaS [Clostridiales bacterium]|jgi:probable dihydroxyacetone kinase regulator|nr:dihydroxyacetone kinase transcriptional activator DhaS [Clostridiales bacterium]